MADHRLQWHVPTYANIAQQAALAEEEEVARLSHNDNVYRSLYEGLEQPRKPLPSVDMLEKFPEVYVCHIPPQREDDPSGAKGSMLAIAAHNIVREAGGKLIPGKFINDFHFFLPAHHPNPLTPSILSTTYPFTSADPPITVDYITNAHASTMPTNSEAKRKEDEKIKTWAANLPTRPQTAMTRMGEGGGRRRVDAEEEDDEQGWDIIPELIEREDVEGHGDGDGR